MKGVREAGLISMSSLQRMAILYQKNVLPTKEKLEETIAKTMRAASQFQE